MKRNKFYISLILILSLLSGCAQKVVPSEVTTEHVQFCSEMLYDVSFNGTTEPFDVYYKDGYVGCSNSDNLTTWYWWDYFEDDGHFDMPLEGIK